MLDPFRHTETGLPRDDVLKGSGDGLEGLGPTGRGGRTRRPRPERDIPATHVSKIITITTLCGYAAVLLLNVLWARPSPGKLALCLVCVTALSGLQLLHTSPRTRRRPMRWKIVTLTLQAILTFLPFVWFGITWGSMGGILGASILLMLPRPVSWVLFALLAASIGGYAIALRLPLISEIYAPLTTLLTGLVLYGLTRLTDLVHEVHTARAELARMAVAQERLRFSRDVHDLLGYSLSAITLKCELIHRLVPTHPGRALDEVASVLNVSRQALADARLVARSYREMSLADEAESAATVMAAADIRITMDIACGRLHPAVDTALATTLREGITNVLRHSKAQSFDIRAVREDTTVRLVLVNDGVVQKGPSAAPAGSGLENLRTRLDAVGGRLTAGVDDDGRFRLMAEVPVRPFPPAPVVTGAERDA
ncbi:sensor histidine kinase [Streptomyces sp. NBC_01538]|uniref:sensor histidine kinase n=1 Tax=Streptomyces sp. NBC_01538 TaxID=2903897 RepID=UPI003866C3BB